MVEFMLSVIFLVLLVVSILEVAAFIYTYSVLANAAKEGVRYAIVHGGNSGSPSGPGTTVTASSPPCTSSNTSTSITNVQSRVRDFAAFSLHKISATGANAMNVYVCYLDGDNKLNSLVEVTVDYQYKPFFFQWPSVRVFANSAGRIVF
jgi:Flp pilus assembly protein TadG